MLADGLKMTCSQYFNIYHGIWHSFSTRLLCSGYLLIAPHSEIRRENVVLETMPTINKEV
jgi:hypothetical protein